MRWFDWTKIHLFIYIWVSQSGLYVYNLYSNTQYVPFLSFMFYFFEKKKKLGRPFGFFFFFDISVCSNTVQVYDIWRQVGARAWNNQVVSSVDIHSYVDMFNGPLFCVWVYAACSCSWVCMTWQHVTYGSVIYDFIFFWTEIKINKLVHPPPKKSKSSMISKCLLSFACTNQSMRGNVNVNTSTGASSHSISQPLCSSEKANTKRLSLSPSLLSLSE